MNKIQRKRREIGLSQSDVAARCGVSRQLLSLVERGKVQPGVETALRLAAVLNTTVERLFSIEAVGEEPVPVSLVPRGPPREGIRLEVAQVEGDWFGAPADTITSVADGFSHCDGTLEIRGGRTYARLHSKLSQLEDNLIISGCDPALALTRGDTSSNHGRIIIHYCGSRQSLEMLNAQSVHIAGFHYPDEEDGGNLARIKARDQADDWAVFRFSTWDIGWLLTPIAERSFRQVEDLLNPELRFANREPGSGARVWLDHQLANRGIQGHRINGFENEHHTHHSCAFALQGGIADVALGPRAIADVFELSFIQASEVGFDLAVPVSYLSLRPISKFLNQLTSRKVQREIEGICGYSAIQAGDRIL